MRFSLVVSCLPCWLESICREFLFLRASRSTGTQLAAESCTTTPSHDAGNDVLRRPAGRNGHPDRRRRDEHEREGHRQGHLSKGHGHSMGEIPRRGGSAAWLVVANGKMARSWHEEAARGNTKKARPESRAFTQALPSARRHLSPSLAVSASASMVEPGGRGGQCLR